MLPYWFLFLVPAFAALVEPESDPSRHRIALLEAAAMARPLIATDVPGCREVVDNGVNGLLCKVRDAFDLAEKMLGNL